MNLKFIMCSDDCCDCLWGEFFFLAFFLPPLPPRFPRSFTSCTPTSCFILPLLPLCLTPSILPSLPPSLALFEMRFLSFLPRRPSLFHPVSWFGSWACSTLYSPGSLWRSWLSTTRPKCPFGKEVKEGFRDSWRSVSSTRPFQIHNPTKK